MSTRAKDVEVRFPGKPDVWLRRYDHPCQRVVGTNTDGSSRECGARPTKQYVQGHRFCKDCNTDPNPTPDPTRTAVALMAGPPLVPPAARQRLDGGT